MQTMTQMEALNKLIGMANGAACSAELDMMHYGGSRGIKARHRLYIAEIGFTEYQKNFELAFAEMQYMIAEHLPAREVINE